MEKPWKMSEKSSENGVEGHGKGDIKGLKNPGKEGGKKSRKNPGERGKKIRETGGGRGGNPGKGERTGSSKSREKIPRKRSREPEGRGRGKCWERAAEPRENGDTKGLKIPVFCAGIPAFPFPTRTEAGNRKGWERDGEKSLENGLENPWKREGKTQEK